MQTFEVQHRSVILRLAANGSGSRSRPLVDQVPAAGNAPQSVVLDLQGVTLSSMLIGELASLVQHLHSEPLYLINVSAMSRQALETVGLAGLVKVLEDLTALPVNPSAPAG